MNRLTQSGLSRRSCSISLAFVLCLFASFATTADSALSQLETFIFKIDTYKANFEQTLYDEDSEPLQRSVGSLQLKRPGRFVWTYTEPEEQQIIADGLRLWMYDKDLEQVTVNSIDERVAGTPLALLMRATPLEDSFAIEELGAVEDIDWLELTPLLESSDFEQIFVGMNKGELAALELRDNFGQATQIVFSEFESGIELSDELFVFKVPDGVDVIGLDGQ